MCYPPKKMPLAVLKQAIQKAFSKGSCLQQAWSKAEFLKRLVYSSGSLVFSVVKYGCIIHCFVSYGFAVTICEGKSMEPYITSGDCFISERFSVRTYRLQRGDVVGVRYHMDPNCFVCKRIVGFEGDKVYNSTTQHHVWVPKGHVWLEGDNKERSLDSRNYGPVPYALIDTKLLFKCKEDWNHLDETVQTGGADWEPMAANFMITPR